VRTTLEGWNIPATDLVMVDGSGLSRYNLITPDALAGILAHVYRDDRLRGPFVETLPIAGVDGTLAARMKGTPAAANARAKTGSFSNARVIAGFVRSANDEPLVFAILANNYGVEAAVIDRASDAIVAALAQFSR
jgi:D-alanyl-D-alanine carboxypeptidase/D-alanyl-D-alanine-endopeptidase (penicillin-binding protein 4)